MELGFKFFRFSKVSLLITASLLLGACGSDSSSEQPITPDPDPIPDPLPTDQAPQITALSLMPGSDIQSQTPLVLLSSCERCVEIFSQRNNDYCQGS